MALENLIRRVDYLEEEMKEIKEVLARNNIQVNRRIN